MREKIKLILAISGLGLYISGIIFGLMYMISDIAGREFQPLVLLIAISLFWFAIGMSEFSSRLYQRYKNPRKQ